MKYLMIVVLCILSAIAYGILHDQITARLCVEYFTIGHPPVFPTESPTLLGIGWGVIATWWVGLLLGIPLAIAARAGTRPRREARSMVRPIITLLVVMAACAVISGVIGYILARSGAVYLVEPLDELIPRSKHAAFLADLWAHSASYLVGFLGGIVVIASVWRSRGRATLAAEPLRNGRPIAARRIPDTPAYLTGNALEAAHRGYLESSDLAAWADALLTIGIDTEAVIQAVANPELHWEKVRPLFSSICREVGLSDDVFTEIATLKQEVMIREYERGHRKAAELLWRFDDLRQRVGFPESVYGRLVEDNANGTNDSGWYSSSGKWRGEELEALARQHLGRAGIRV